MVIGGLVRLALLGFLGALSACTIGAERPSYPELTWGHLPPITLDVAEIEIIDASPAPGASPHVEHLFPLPPAKAAERWAITGRWKKSVKPDSLTGAGYTQPQRIDQRG